MSTTAKARVTRQTKFDRLVDPDGLLSPEERAYRASQAKKAHNTRVTQSRMYRPSSGRRGRGGEI